MGRKKKEKKSTKRSKMEDESVSPVGTVDKKPKVEEHDSEEMDRVREKVKAINEDMIREGKDMFIKSVPEKIKELTEFIAVVAWGLKAD